MAIIYTYPVKTTPVDADLVLISDSEDSNNTKQVTISSIKSLTAGVTSVTATSPLIASAATGDTTLSLSGLSALGTAGQVIKVNSVATALEFGTVSGGDLPIEEEGSQITAAAAKINFTGTGATASASGNDVTVNIPAISIENSGVALISGITTLDFGTNLTPTSAGPGTNKVTIDASSGGISFSGSTANGIATYSSATSANVSSAFTISGNKLSAPAGAEADPSVEVGAVGGLYAASGGIFLAHSGASAIGVNSTSIVNYKITQFNAGLKFGVSGSTLSTYTEATWTGGPTLTFSVGGVATLSASAGSYRVIGDMVFAQFQFTFGASGNYGTVDMSLPLSGVAGTGSINFAKMNSNVGNSAVSTPVTGDILTSAASIRLQSFNYDQDSSSHVSGQLFELVATSGQPVFQNGDVVSGTIIYRKS